MEIAPASCMPCSNHFRLEFTILFSGLFHGSIYVSRRAKQFLQRACYVELLR